ncbi:MAG: branched-chain amino acid ABC transporter permease [Burkholderiales bacterium]|nr:branched-chain amino acid ABC transporter permease [Phycisphaerae bacterium]
MLAVSLNIVNGFTGQFSIGHAAFYAIGGYVAGMISYYASIQLWDSPTSWGSILSPTSINVVYQSLIFVIALLCGGIVAALAGWLVGLPSLRLRGDYLAIVTLGFGEIVRVLLQQTNEQIFTRSDLHAASRDELFPPPVGGALGFINIPKMTSLFWAVLLACACVLFAWRLKKSTFGRAMIAIRENEIAAEAMGVNITRLKVWAFVFAAFFAGIAGGLYAHEAGTQIGPGDAGFTRSFDVVIMVVLGGLGSITGSILAATILTIANEWLREPTHVWHIGLALLALRLMVQPKQRFRAIVWSLSAIAAIEGARSIAIRLQIDLGEYRMVIFALMLIVMMILRPQGLFGTHEFSDLLPRRRRPGRGFEVST